METILENVPEQRQTMLFSATLPKWVKKLVSAGAARRGAACRGWNAGAPSPLLLARCGSAGRVGWAGGGRTYAMTPGPSSWLKSSGLGAGVRHSLAHPAGWDSLALSALAPTAAALPC